MEACCVCHDRPGEPGKCHPLCAECEQKLKRPMCPVCRKRLRFALLGELLVACRHEPLQPVPTQALRAAEEHQAQVMDDALDAAVEAEAWRVIATGGPGFVGAMDLLPANAPRWVDGLRKRGMFGAGVYGVHVLLMPFEGEPNILPSAYSVNLDDPLRATVPCDVFRTVVDYEPKWACFVLRAAFPKRSCTTVSLGFYRKWELNAEESDDESDDE